jgi:IclR family acetate operon transcriptional repressor
MTDRETLLQELAVTRQRGYGMDDEEMEAGVRAVSALIRNREGMGVAALSVPGPTSRLTMERVPKVAATVCEAADAVSRELGWRK